MVLSKIATFRAHMVKKSRPALFSTVDWESHFPINSHIVVS